MPLKVIVVGAGIGGLCAALSLRYQGFDVEIFEKSSIAGEVGAALAISPNGAKALEGLGFSFDRARACDINAWDTLDCKSLSPLASVDLSKAKQVFGARGRTIHRVDLHNELLRLAITDSTDSEGSPAFNKPAKLRLGTRVVSASPDGTVILQDGSHHQADLVVGADGLRSVVRKAVLDPEVTRNPSHSGSAAFRFLIETEELQKDPRLAQLLQARQGRATTIVDTGDSRERHVMWYPCRDGKTQNFVGVHPSTDETIQDDQEARESMLKEFAHFHPSVQEMMKLATTVRRWPLFMHDPFSTWTNGQIVLIGDAAHPMLPFGGQGSNIAIEDGVALGCLLKDVGDTSQVARRLVMFQHLRRRRAARVQIMSKVRVNHEREVIEEVRHYLDNPGDLLPTSMRERTIHDYSYDVYTECQNLLVEQAGNI